MDRTVDLEESVSEDLEKAPTLLDVMMLWDIAELYNEFFSQIKRDIERDIGNMETVHLLDFDIVYACLWRALNTERNPPYNRLCGLPQSMMHFIRHNERPFCLPFGTSLEMSILIAGLGAEATDLGSTARGFVDPEPQQENASDNAPARPTPKQMQAFDAKFETQSRSVAKARDDLYVLRRILSLKNLRPPEYLSKGHGMKEEDWAIRDVMYDWLNRVRKGRKKANLADAYNLAWYVSVSDRDDNRVPLMATGTRPVFDAPIGRFLPTRSRQTVSGIAEKPVIASRYLTFSTAFAQYGEQKKERQLTLAEAARVSLQPVLDAQADYRDWGMKPQWRDREAKPEEVVWKDLAANRLFNKWAMAFLRWRREYLDEVLRLFEHFGTTDRQLRNTYLQSRDMLESALADRKQFDGKIARDDWLSASVGTVATLAGRMALKLGEVGTDDVLLRNIQSWQVEIEITRDRAGSSSRWILRSRREEQSTPLLAEACLLDSGRWEFSWPVRLDIGEIITSLKHICGILGEKSPGEVELKPSTGSPKTIPLTERKALAKALRECHLDFDLTMATGDTTICFVCDSSLFEERQGIDLYVEVADVGPERIAGMHELTSRYLASPDRLAAALRAVLSSAGPTGTATDEKE